MNDNERQVDNLLSLLALVRIAPRRIVLPIFVRSRASQKEECRQARIRHKKLLLQQTEDRGKLANINGDLAFLTKDYLQALQKYSISISLNFDHKVYLKRGRVNRKLKNYSLALHDCLKFQLEEQGKLRVAEPYRMAKALLLEGQCRAELCKTMDFAVVFDEIKKAKDCIQRAYNVFNESSKDTLKKRSQKYELRVKKLEWYLQLQFKKEKNRILLRDYIEQKKPTSEEIKQFKYTLDERLPKIGIIPDQYVCGITQEIMIEPAITSAGMAYEKSAIETHIYLNGPKDPIKRCPIKNTVYECHQLKLILLNYIYENPWAFESSPQDDYQNIRF